MCQRPCCSGPSTWVHVLLFPSRGFYDKEVLGASTWVRGQTPPPSERSFQKRGWGSPQTKEVSHVLERTFGFLSLKKKQNSKTFHKVKKNLKDER